MGLLFKKENQIEVFGCNGQVTITETDEYQVMTSVVMSLRQFEEMTNRYKHIVAEASEDSNGLD